MLFNEDYTVESVRELVREFIETGTYDKHECYIVDEESCYASSHAFQVMDGVYIQYSGICHPHWMISDHRGLKRKYYSLHPQRSTTSILWKAEIEVAPHETGSMLVIAPTRRMAKLEAKYGLYAGQWGPREVRSTTPISKVDAESIPWTMQATY